MSICSSTPTLISQSAWCSHVRCLQVKLRNSTPKNRAPYHSVPLKTLLQNVIYSVQQDGSCLTPCFNAIGKVCRFPPSSWMTSKSEQGSPVMCVFFFFGKAEPLLWLFHLLGDSFALGLSRLLAPLMHWGNEEFRKAQACVNAQKHIIHVHSQTQENGL